MAHGSIILLNGVTSSGKSSIAKSLQGQLEEPFLHLGIDVFTQMLPSAYYSFTQPPENVLALQGFHWEPMLENDKAMGFIRAGPVVHRLIRGMHRACAAFASSGNHLIIDDVLFYEDWLLDYLNVLKDFKVLFVGVRCPLDELERRERERGDRNIGQARGQIDIVHANSLYDIEVDTSISNPAECAARIIERLQNGPVPQAFNSLRRELIEQRR